MLAILPPIFAFVRPNFPSACSVVWLKGIVMSVCVSSSELQAARALARLLCHAHSPAQVRMYSATPTHQPISLPSFLARYSDVYFC